MSKIIEMQNKETKKIQNRKLRTENNAKLI